MSGVTPTGFEIETVEDILTSVEESERALISRRLSLSSASLMGQLNGIVAAAIGACWEAAQAVYAQFDPNGAEGVAADTVAALVGVYRQRAARTVVPTNCTVAAGFSALAGGMVLTVAGDATRRFTNVSVVRSPGGGVVSVQFQCTRTGPVVVPAHTLTAMTPTLSGWISADNPADGIVGRDRETDQELHLRREQEIAAIGSGSAPAIRTAVGEVSGVSSVRVLVNDGDGVDGNGVPAHAIEVVVSGGADQDIAQAIFENVAGGIKANGTTVVAVVDEFGESHAIGFTRVVDTPVYLHIEVVTDSDYGGDANLKESLAAWGDTYFTAGQLVVGSRIGAQLFSLEGVTQVPNVYLGLAPSPVTTTPLVIDVRHRAVLSVLNTAVTHV